MVLLLGACKSPFVDDAAEPSPQPADQGEPATELSQDAEQSLTDGGPDGGSGSPQDSPGGSSAGSAREFRTFARISDRSGDAAAGPPYADLVSITLQDDGVSLRLIVEVGGELPERLEDDEIEGIGIDFFVTESKESDYQLFADGGLEGWFGYLQTPDGFKDPGTFQVGGSHIVFVTPWASLGEMRSGTFNSFADWSKAGLPVVNPSSRDLAPDSGDQSFKR